MADRWQTAFDEHQAALDRYAEAVRSMDGHRWVREREPGQWSPAQITEHLILTYQVGLRLLHGEQAMRFRVGPIRRTLFRWFIMPHVLFHRSFPTRVPAPREIRPVGEALSPEESVRELRAAVAAAEQRLHEVRADRGLRISHPYFGRISALHFLELASTHMDHHGRQVETTPNTQIPQA